MKLGFIGMGNMGYALAEGLVKFAGISPEDICAYAPNYEKLLKNAEKLGFVPSKTLEEIKQADTIVMACKPYQIESVLAELGDISGKNILSVAFGWDLAKYSEYVDINKVGVQYTIPNTPVSIGAGVILMETESSMTESDRNDLIDILSKFSKVVELDAKLMTAGSAIAGSAPAFVDVFIEALADGGVKNGIPRAKAYEIIPQMVIGAAKLMQETGLHPGVLKDQVCSPGGTTIRGVDAMEKGGVRAAMIDAVDKTCGK